MSRHLLVASEYGEPSLHSKVLSQRIFDLVSQSVPVGFCLLLITKNLPECTQILDMADMFKMPTQIHCTITGLGNTAVEPHIPFPGYVSEQSVELIRKHGISPEAVTVRIDPIIPELLHKQMDTIPRTLENFAKIGVKDCRISVVDYYPHVRKRFDKLGIDHPKAFQASKITISSIIAQMAKLTKEHEMRLHLCAESIPLLTELNSNIDDEGCASYASWERLGITNLEPSVRKQRKECTCNLYKGDLLKGLDKGCDPGCAYCYWKRVTDLD